jgi:hypothetical protein
VPWEERIEESYEKELEKYSYLLRILVRIEDRGLGAF